MAAREIICLEFTIKKPKKNPWRSTAEFFMKFEKIPARVSDVFIAVLKKGFVCFESLFLAGRVIAVT